MWGAEENQDFYRFQECSVRYFFVSQLAEDEGLDW